jgi:ferric-dicitrate binding protein FerR (iron transport regulator)
MGMTSPAEAKLDARVRPQIAAMQARSGYPRLRVVGTEPVTEATETVADRAEAAAPAGSRWRAKRTPIRLTRRGRIVVGALVAIGAAAAASLIWLAVAGQAQASNHTGSQVPLRDSMQRVVVEPGESLWSIAVKADPEADPRAVIPQIIELNSLRGTGIQAGQVLWVPKD